MIHVQKGVYTVNEKMTELKSFYKLVKYVWKKLVAAVSYTHLTLPTKA